MIFFSFSQFSLIADSAIIFSFPIVSQTFMYALWMRYEIKRRLLEHHPCSTVTVDPITEIEWQAGSLHSMNTLDKKKMILISHLEKCGPDGSIFHCIMYSFIFYFLFIHLFNHSVEAFHCTVQTSFFFFHFFFRQLFFFQNCDCRPRVLFYIQVFQRKWLASQRTTLVRRELNLLCHYSVYLTDSCVCNILHKWKITMINLKMWERNLLN